MSSTPTKVTRKPPKERETEIRAAAIAMALSDGLDGVTLRRIASRIGVTSPLVAHYHPNMEALVAETFTAIVAAEIVELRAIVARSPNSVAAMSSYLDFLLLDSRDDVTVIWLDGWSRGRRNPSLALAVREQMDAWQQFTHGILTTGVAADEFRVGDADRAAWRLLGIIDGLNAHSLVHVGDPLTVRHEVATLAETELGLPAGALATSRR